MDDQINHHFKTMNKKEILKEYSTPWGKIFLKLAQRKKCLFCKTKMDIVEKRPKQARAVNAYDIFTPDFLVHCQTTHGYPPEVLTMFFKQLIKKHNEFQNKTIQNKKTR